MHNHPSVHTLKNDRYAKARGGNSHFLDLHCGRCRQHIALYQKDGEGGLLRLYLDRIFAPPSLQALQAKSSKKDLPVLKCSNPRCNAIIGVPMVYEKEGRLAFRLLRGSIVKKRSDGVYPPQQS